MANAGNNESIVLLTAGAGGMFCGSCLHDNRLVASWQQSGIDALLVPMYTPIRTDEIDVSINRVFFGGINVFLREKLPWMRLVPRATLRWLDHPRVLRWITERRMETDASKLGGLTVSMLQGEQGRQRGEVDLLCDWLEAEVHPSVLIFSNLLIAGSGPRIKQRLRIPLFATLQGDDIFLRGLPPKDLERALVEIHRLAASIDGFLVHSDFYADQMAMFLNLPRDKFYRVPLAVTAHDFAGERPARKPGQAPIIGYLARQTPEKGLELLCEAFLRLRSLPETRDVRLHVAGWYGPQQRTFVERCLGAVQRTAGADAVRQFGAVDRAGKIEFLRGIDLLSVPSPYADPKGLYVLEALAAGVPVVQPRHGAFPELIESTGGGTLFEPNDVESLTRELTRLLADDALRAAHGNAGRQAVLQKHDVGIAADQTLALLRTIVAPMP